MVHLALAATAVLLAAPDPPSRCESLARLSLDRATVTRTETIGRGDWKSPDGDLLPGLPATCRVTLRLSPSAGSSIQAEVWLPLEGWNGRFLGTGNGSYGGVIDHGALASGVTRGFAAANDDMGPCRPRGWTAAPSPASR